MSSLNLPQLAHQGIPVVSTESLAMAYEVEPNQIRQNYKRNKTRFIEGKHFYTLSGNDLKEFKNRVTNCHSVSKNAKSLTLWTERGAARHAKMLNSDKAWDVFELLEETFFRVAEQRDDARISTIDERRPLSVLVGQWAGKARMSFPDCWRELHGVFGIATIAELPPSQLPAAIAWVQAKIDGLTPRNFPAQPAPHQMAQPAKFIPNPGYTTISLEELEDQLGTLLARAENTKPPYLAPQGFLEKICTPDDPLLPGQLQRMFFAQYHAGLNLLRETYRMVHACYADSLRLEKAATR